MKDKFLKCVAYDLSVDFWSFLPKDAIGKREDISFLKHFKANIELVCLDFWNSVLTIETWIKIKYPESSFSCFSHIHSFFFIIMLQ